MVPASIPPPGGRRTGSPRPSPSKGGRQPGSRADERLRARVEGKVLKSEEAAALVQRLDAELAALRHRHEQYFLGLEHRAPDREREALRGRIEDLRRQVGPNTALQFQVQSLFDRFLTYERMWVRTEKDREEGRYARDLFKARLHARNRDARGSPPPPSEPHKPKAPPRATGPLPSEERMRAIYDTYVRAKKECREDVSGLTYEVLAGQLREQGPALLAGSKAKALDFKVVIRDGKAILRAVTID